MCSMRVAVRNVMASLYRTDTLDVTRIHYICNSIEHDINIEYLMLK